jgi:hypothetical protein
LTQTVIVLPPREGFSPSAVGAVGMMVRLLAAPNDLVIGAKLRAEPFQSPHFTPVSSVFWPPFGRTERYMAGAVKRLRALRPSLVEVHNRANLACDVARALPGVPVSLFLHNDPQAMRAARTPAERAALLRRLTVICVSDYLRARFMEGVNPGPGTAERAGTRIATATAAAGSPRENRALRRPRGSRQRRRRLRHCLRNRAGAPPRLARHDDRRRPVFPGQPGNSFSP